MRTSTFVFKIAITFVLFIVLVTEVRAQGLHSEPSQQFKNFAKKLSAMGIKFEFPPGFKEIKAVNNRDFPFTYAMEIPEQNFEIWFSAENEKANEKFLKQNKLRIPADSAYNAIALKQAAAFSNETDWQAREIPEEILMRYNADAGKFYSLNLNDSAVTGHYKYALLVSLAKYNVGTLLAVCFTNNKGPEFFKNMYQASNCFKFPSAAKPQN